MKREEINEYLVIVLGTILMAFAIHMFYSPNQLVTGGVTGIAIVVETLSTKYFGYTVPIWLTNILLNFPLFLIGIKVNGLTFLKKTLFATISLTIALYFMKYIPVIEMDESDLIVSSLFGGAITGVGLGLVFRCFATTGGSDLAATILHKYLKHISLSKLLFVLDAAVIVLGLFVFGSVKAMYAIIVVFTTSKVIDAILEGLSFSKAAFIISDHAIEISNIIMKQLSRGVTNLLGKGMYTGNDKNVLFCVVSQKEIITLKEIVSEIDKKAFIIVTDAREVLGEGFNQP